MEPNPRPSLRIRFHCNTLPEFIERYGVDVSPGGIFIRTEDPDPLNSELSFRFELLDGSVLLQGRASVFSVRATDPEDPELIAGMCLFFEELDEPSQAVFQTVLEADPRWTRFLAGEEDPAGEESEEDDGDEDEDDEVEPLEFAVPAAGRASPPPSNPDSV